MANILTLLKNALINASKTTPTSYSHPSIEISSSAIQSPNIILPVSMPNVDKYISTIESLIKSLLSSPNKDDARKLVQVLTDLERKLGRAKYELIINQIKASLVGTPYYSLFDAALSGKADVVYQRALNTIKKMRIERLAKEVGVTPSFVQLFSDKTGRISAEKIREFLKMKAGLLTKNVSKIEPKRLVMSIVEMKNALKLANASLGPKHVGMILTELKRYKLGNIPLSKVVEPNKPLDIKKILKEISEVKKGELKAKAMVMAKRPEELRSEMKKKIEELRKERKEIAKKAVGVEKKMMGEMLSRIMESTRH